MLASIYRYVGDLLVRANVTKSPTPALEARRHLAELGDAFRQAAKQVATGPLVSAPASSSAFAAAAAGSPSRLSVRA